MSAVMEVSSGLMVDVMNARPEDIDINDIAHALAHLPRFGGHLMRHYSVAEHSIWVSKMVPPEFALQGLMHDATEAYLVDMPTPIKKHFPLYYEIEKKLHAVICERFGIDPAMPDEVREADARMCITEKIALLSDNNLDHPEWTPLTSKFEAYDHIHISRKTYLHQTIAGRFLDRFEELTNK